MFTSSKETTIEAPSVTATIAAPATTDAPSPLPSVSDVFNKFRAAVPTKNEVIGALTGAVPEGAVISPDVRQRQQPTRRSQRGGGGVLSSPLVNLVALGAASAFTTYAAVAIYRNWSANYANLTIMETVHLPAETTDSFVELCIPLEGEVRLACSLLSRCKFILRLNASLKPLVTGSPHSRSRSRRLNTMSNGSMLSNDAASSRASFSSRGSKVGSVVIQDVEMNEICDAWQSAETGRLHFAPSSSSEGTVLMRYKAESNDNFQSPLCIKQCWVQPASAPNAHRLSYELFVHGPCMDVAVTIIFPKGAQLLSVDTQGVGHWQNAGPYAPNEIVWHVGSYTKEKSGVETAMGVMGGLVGGKGKNQNINNAGNVQYDSVRATNAAGSEAPEEEGGEQQPVILNGDLPLASIRFQAVYTINAIPHTQEEVKINRKERRRQEREQKKDDKKAGRRQTASAEMEQLRRDMDEAENDANPGNAVEFDPVVNVPAVCVAFSTNTSTSGLAVKQLKAADERVHYDLLTDVFGGADYWSKEEIYRRGESARERFTRRTVVNVVSFYGFSKNLATKSYRKISAKLRGEPEPFLTSEELPDEEELSRRRQKVADAAVRRFGRESSVEYKLDGHGNYVPNEDRLASTVPSLKTGKN